MYTRRSGAEFARIIETGLPVEAAGILSQRTHMSVKKFAQLIPRSTLESRRKSPNKTLTPEQYDRVMRVAEAYAHVAETFGDPDRAERWMKRTNRQMPDAPTPEQMLLTSYRARHVGDALSPTGC